MTDLPVLTRLLLESVQFQSPQRGGMFRPKLRYAHQGGMNEFDHRGQFVVIATFVSQGTSHEQQ